MNVIPKTINICGVPYKITYGKNDYNPIDQFGQIIYVKGEIMINPDMPEELQIQTLIHEWVHGVLTLSGHNKETGNELLVNSLALAISGTFKLKEE